MVEVPMSDVVAKLKLADTAQIVVLDVDGQQVPYQVTYDEKVGLPRYGGGNSVVTYTIQPGHYRHLLMSLLAVNTPERLAT